MASIEGVRNDTNYSISYTLRNPFYTTIGPKMRARSTCQLLSRVGKIDQLLSRLLGLYISGDYLRQFVQRRQEHDSPIKADSRSWTQPAVTLQGEIAGKSYEQRQMTLAPCPGPRL